MLLHYLDGDLVKMQFQMSSMGTIGNPITYFMNYPGRFLSCHLQAVDTTQGMRAVAPAALPVKGETPQGRRGGGAQGPAMALGEDTADWPKIFAAAKTGGLKYAFVEQNSLDVVGRSVAYLKTLS